MKKLKDCLVTGEPPPSLSGAVCSLWLTLLVAPHPAHAYVPPGPHSLSPISLAPLPLGLQSSRFLSSQPLDIPRSLPHPHSSSTQPCPRPSPCPRPALTGPSFPSPRLVHLSFAHVGSLGSRLFFPECKGLHLPSTKIRRGQPESGGMAVSPSMHISHLILGYQMLAMRAHLASFPIPPPGVSLRNILACSFCACVSPSVTLELFSHCPPAHPISKVRLFKPASLGSWRACKTRNGPHQKFSLCGAGGEGVCDRICMSVTSPPQLPR